MRRFAVLFAIVMLATSVGLSATAGAREARPSSFCGTAKNLADDFKSFDTEDFTDAKVFQTAERVYKKLAKDAPQSLKASFRTINRFYGSLKDSDPTDPDDAAAFIEQSTRAGRALNRVIKYLSSKCKIDLG